MSIETIPVEDMAAVAAATADVPRRQFVRELVRQKLFIVGAAILLFWILAAIFGSLVVKSPYAQNLPLDQHGRRPGRTGSAPISSGADMILPVSSSARVTSSSPLRWRRCSARLIGTALGLVMGYFRGFVDEFVGRIVEAFLALPLVVTGILGVVALGASNSTLIIVIGIVFTPVIARTVRSAVLTERDLDYVAAAKLRGENAMHIMFVEILPISSHRSSSSSRCAWAMRSSRS